MTSAGFEWDLEYDAAWFIPLPDAGPNGVDPELASAWVDEAVERFSRWQGMDTTSLAMLRATAEALVAQASAGVTHLWFAPDGLYSDLLVAIDPVRSADAPSTEEMFGDESFSVAFDVTPVRTETHGGGYLVRRSTQVRGDEPLLITQWTLRVNDGVWTVLIDTLGTAAPAFVLFEEQLWRLLVGIALPK